MGSIIRWEGSMIELGFRKKGFSDYSYFFVKIDAKLKDLYCNRQDETHPECLMGCQCFQITFF